MSRQPRSQPAPASSASRQNEYFVPRDGIDREVISADICRYLGNDALVRPGHYENPQSGQVVQGYYITAYRNLTTAMIEDLKADSARWDSERRAQTSSRNTPGGSFTSRDAPSAPARPSSNSPVVQYRSSETHQSRQHHGPTEGPPFQPDPYARDAAFDGPRYPGTGAPGYTGAAGSYQQQPNAYGATSGGSYGYQPPQQSPQPDPRYPSAFSQPSQPMDRGFPPAQDNQPPYVQMGTNMPRGYGSNDSYSGNRMPSSGAAPQPVYVSAPPPQSGYPATSSPYNYQGQPPAPGGQVYPTTHTPESGFGRISPTGKTPQQPSGCSIPSHQYTDSPGSHSSFQPTGITSQRCSDMDDDRRYHQPW